MNGNYTFSIIKPNAVRTGKTGPILAMINEAGFEITAMKMLRMTNHEAEDFDEVHRERSSSSSSRQPSACAVSVSPTTRAFSNCVGRMSSGMTSS